MATALSTVRTSIATTLASAITTAQVYRRRQTNPHCPCLVIGWPDEFDFRPTLGAGERDITIPVWVGVEVADDDSSDDLLSSLMESAVTALQTSAWDVQPATNFGEAVTDDGRTIIWAALPVAVFA